MYHTRKHILLNRCSIPVLQHIILTVHDIIFFEPKFRIDKNVQYVFKTECFNKKKFNSKVSTVPICCHECPWMFNKTVAKKQYASHFLTAMLAASVFACDIPYMIKIRRQLLRCHGERYQCSWLCSSYAIPIASTVRVRCSLAGC